MPNRRDGFLARLIATGLAVLCLAVIGLAAASSKATSAPSATVGPAEQTTGFVGDETCATCHDTQANAMRATLHGKGHNPRTPSANRTGVRNLSRRGQAALRDRRSHQDLRAST